MFAIALMLCVDTDAQRARNRRRGINDTVRVDSIGATPMSADTIKRKKKQPLDAPVTYEATDSIVFTEGGFAHLFGEGKVNAEEGFFKDGDEKKFTTSDFRFTYKNGTLYTFQMRPDGNTVKIKSLRRCDMRYVLFDKIELLGYGEVSYKRTKEALEITLPEGVNTDLPLCFKINIL